MLTLTNGIYMKRKDFESNEESDNEDRKFLRTENAEVQNPEAEENIEDEIAHIIVYSENENVQDLVKAIIEHDLESFKAIIDANLDLLEQEFPVDTKRDRTTVGYNILHMLVDEEFLEGLNYLLENYRQRVNIEVAINEQEVLAAEDEDFFEVSRTHDHTLLMLASLVGNDSIVNALINAGANVNGTNIYNETPLLIAAGDVHLAVVKLLLLHNAEIDKLSKVGEGTALFEALKYGRIELARELIKAGANVTIRQVTFQNLSKTIYYKNTPLGIMCGINKILSEKVCISLLIDLFETHKFYFNEVELELIKTSPFKKVQNLINDYVTFTRAVQPDIANELHMKALFKSFLKSPEFIRKLVDSYLKVKNMDLAASNEDSKTINALKLISCTGKIQGGDNDKKIILIDLIKEKQDLEIIKILVRNYYYVNKFKMIAKDIEDYISKLLINIGPNMNPLKEHKIKDYNSILFQVKNDLINEAIKISQSLETLEKCLVDMLDSDFNEILTYNKKDLENKGLIKKGLPPKWDLQSKPTAHEGIESVLGLKGRVETNESDNGFEGEIYGSGEILELFLSKLDTVNFEIDASSVTFDIKEFFNGLKTLVNQVSYNLSPEAKAKLYSFIETNQNIASADSAQVAEIEPNIVVDAHAAEMPDNHSTEGNMDLSGDVHTS
jgi:hypothetical protein